MRRRSLLVPLAALFWLAAAAAAAPVALAADPPPERVEGQRVYDPDGILGESLAATAEQLADLMADLHDIEVVLIARQRGGTVDEPDLEATQGAADVVRTWGLDRAVVLYVEAPFSGCNAGIGIATAEPLPGARLDPGGLIDPNIRRAQETCEPGVAAIETLGNVVTSLSGIGPAGEPTRSNAGPPFPDPEIDRAVYDQAGVFTPETIAEAEATIDAIEARTGAEVVVYSQVADYGITTEEADGHAQALMDQWGVGRKGFDDGLVILFDLDPSLEHGQVILYGGPGYRAAYLDNGEKQRIFDEDMLPLLRQADLNGALRVALDRVDANATPEHAQRLQVARQVDAAVGLVGAPVIALVLIGSGVFAWLRYGRDPVYLDDPSIHMAGPPPDLTPAAAAFVVNGGPSRRALTAAMLDLASRGEIAFREESELLGLRTKVGIEIDPPAADGNEEARRARNGVRPLGPAESLARSRLTTLGGDGYIAPDELLGFGTAVPAFDKALEAEVVRNGWFREKPTKAIGRWSVRGVIAIVLGVVAVVGGLNLPSNGLLFIGVALVVGGISLVFISRFMQAVTLPGAMIRAMLAAYRRTLEKTMAQARSMDQVVAEAGLAWLETPDQAVVWGVALGLDKKVEDVLERSIDDVKQGRVAPGSAYLPVWYGSGGDGGGSSGFGSGGGGLFSSGGIPNLGGMMGALSTIGNSPGGSSSSGGGGFGGGSSGGGGGGSGGGF